MAESRTTEMEKEVLRLPDGRRLILYRFASAPAPAAPARPPPGAAEGGAPGEG